MIRITQLKLPMVHTDEDLRNQIAKGLKIPVEKIAKYQIVKKSIDARKKNEIKYIYSVDVTITIGKKESLQSIIYHSRNQNIAIVEVVKYQFTPTGTRKLSHRPIVVGTGPAGLFAAWLLAQHGFQPLVIERGDEVANRVSAVEKFWNSNELNPNSNVQFGEGGAGTFSDGKLNTMVKDASNRHHLVLETFASFGAPSDILYLGKPHIGTDKLRMVVESMRKEIIRLGGEVRFLTKMSDLRIENCKLKGIVLNDKEEVPCEVVVSAIGHSARDTFSLFQKRGLDLSPKAFAIGLRIEHKQSLISSSQYGSNYSKLPPADYKLTHQTAKGRGVYSFCMCPGGYVVNSSSEVGHLVVNGMSNYNRDAENANSAIVVTVQPEDFMVAGKDPLCGVAFQRKWEKLAYQTGGGLIPIQLFGDLLRNRESVTIGNITPSIKGQYHMANLAHCLPSEIIASLIEGIQAFDTKIKGFANEEAVLSGVETRTSSPVRIQRDEAFESNIKGIYPCGEGAGYAGGITSAAIDGIKVFEAIASKYCPDYE